jgi:hypothetical protein
MDRKIILRIKIDGKNWNELINLPCVQELTKGDERIIKDESKRTPHVHLYDGYMPEELRLKALPPFRENLKRLWDKDSPMMRHVLASNGNIGDELVKYDDNTWQIIKGNK